MTIVQSIARPVYTHTYTHVYLIYKVTDISMACSRLREDEDNKRESAYFSKHNTHIQPTGKKGKYEFLDVCHISMHTLYHYNIQHRSK